MSQDTGGAGGRSGLGASQLGDTFPDNYEKRILLRVRKCRAPRGSRAVGLEAGCRVLACGYSVALQCCFGRAEHVLLGLE